MLGTAELMEYVAKYGVQLDSHYDDQLGNFPKKDWSKFISASNAALASDDGLDLLTKMLRYDHAERVTPLEAMEHPYF